MKFSSDEKDSAKAWFIFFMVCLNGSIVSTFMHQYSQIYIHLMDYFNFSSAQAQFIPSVNMGLRLMISPMIIQTIKKLGFRNTNFFGSLMVSVSTFLSFFCQSYFSFLVTLGIIPMLSLSLVFFSNTFVIKDIFERHERKGFGIYYSFFSIVNMAMVYIMNWMIETYLIRGALLIFSGFLLQGAFCSFFYTENTFPRTDRTKETLKLRAMEYKVASLQRETIIFYLGMFFSCLSASTGEILVMDNAAEYGYSKNLILLLPTLEDIFGIGIRIAAGVMFDSSIMKPYNFIVYSLFVLVYSTSHLMNNLAGYGYAYLVLAMLLRGIGNSVFIPQIVIPACHLATVETQIPIIFSVAQTFRGVGIFVGNIISGKLKDIYGSYRPSLYFIWSTHLFGFLLFLLSSTLHRYKSKRKDESQEKVGMLNMREISHQKTKE